MVPLPPVEPCFVTRSMEALRKRRAGSGGEWRWVKGSERSGGRVTPREPVASRGLREVARGIS
jgi:hypothetical protein